MSKKFYKPPTKFHITRILYIIGFCSIAIATYFFAVEIPSIDSNLSLLRTNMRSALFSNIEFNLHQHHIQMMSGQHDIISEINPKSNKLSIFRQIIKSSQIRLLKNTYHELTGEHPNKVNIQRWNEMTPHELGKEFDKIYTDLADSVSYVSGSKVLTFHSDRAEKITSLESHKSSILFWAILLQIFGLGINQLAIIINLSKR